MTASEIRASLNGAAEAMQLAEEQMQAMLAQLQRNSEQRFALLDASQHVRVALEHVYSAEVEIDKLRAGEANHDHHHR